MKERLDQMRRRQGTMIQSFLNAEEGKGWVEKHYEVEEGKMLILSKGGETLPTSLLRRLLKYQEERVLYPEGKNLDRSDCLDVALSFSDAFEKEAEFAEFRREGYLVDRISAGGPVKNPIPFYREQNFGFHVINLIEHFLEEGTSVHAAVDLTAHYNMDIEQGHNDVFIVIAGSREELLHTLRSVTRTRWAVEE